MTTTRTAPATMDQLRVRTLRGDRLRDLTDRQREWVWRSVLKGVRRQETIALGHFSEGEYAKGVERVRGWYDQRIEMYKRQQAREQAPKVVRPVMAPPQRRGFLQRWWKGR
jgi:hypothetical protein